jgi:hypothetical protein
VHDSFKPSLNDPHKSMMFVGPFRRSFRFLAKNSRPSVSYLNIQICVINESVKQGSTYFEVTSCPSALEYAARMKKDAPVFRFMY